MKKQSANSCLGVLRFCGTARVGCALGAALILLALCGQAQAQRITGVEPAACASGENITVTGEDLGKNSVKGVFLALDGKSFPAEIVQKAQGTLTVKVPKVAAGTYKLGLQVGKDSYIDPVELTIK
ncbi:MAG: IPT/TIG domain-containing protein [Acidobacteria bacterium]|nr:IPT/TIG domain-containing protein [Acidobacteriota bacterium]